MATEVTPRTTCRACGSANLTELFSLGEQFVSDFVTAEGIASAPRVPIALDLCNGCTLVQQRYTAPSDFMFSRHYWYYSGTTQTMKKALADVVDAAMGKVPLSPGDVVLDIGSNDGTLLRCYPKELGLVAVGVEPATNMREEGSKGITHFINEFWSFENYQIESLVTWNGPKKAKIITACGCFYDLDNPSTFIADIAKVLHPDGVFVAQLMCLKQTVELGDVGNFAHEHLEFYSLTSLSVLFGNAGLEVFDVEENAVNGGSYRLYVRRIRDQRETMATPGWDRFGRALRVEMRDLKLHDPATYVALFARMTANRNKCVAFIRERVAAGEGVWIYGASTKGNVIAQWYGLDTTLIQGAADKSAEKWTKFMVGTGIPITSEAVARESADWFLVMPYSFKTEFIEREKPWRAGGGKGFLFPLPEFEVV